MCGPSGSLTMHGRKVSFLLELPRGAHKKQEKFRERPGAFGDQCLKRRGDKGIKNNLKKLNNCDFVFAHCKEI